MQVSIQKQKILLEFHSHYSLENHQIETLKQHDETVKTISENHPQSLQKLALQKENQDLSFLMNPFNFNKEKCSSFQPNKL